MVEKKEFEERKSAERDVKPVWREKGSVEKS